MLSYLDDTYMLSLFLKQLKKYTLNYKLKLRLTSVPRFWVLMDFLYFQCHVSSNEIIIVHN
jgi:hypothetical protein